MVEIVRRAAHDVDGEVPRRLLRRLIDLQQHRQVAMVPCDLHREFVSRRHQLVAAPVVHGHPGQEGEPVLGDGPPQEFVQVAG